MPYGRRFKRRRFTRRRYGRRRFSRRRGFKRGVLRALHNRPKPEWKWENDTAIIVPTAALSPATYSIGDVAQGDGPSERTGGRIELKKLILQIIVLPNIAATTVHSTTLQTNIQCRLDLVRVFDQYTNAAPPSFTRFFTSGTTISQVKPITAADRGRGRVIWSKRILVAPSAEDGSFNILTAGRMSWFKKTIRFRNSKIIFDGALATSVRRGGLVLYIATDWDSGIELHVNSMLKFTDT